MILIGGDIFIQSNFEFFNAVSNFLEDNVGYVFQNTVEAYPEKIYDLVIASKVDTLIVDSGHDPWYLNHVIELAESLKLPVKLFYVTGDFKYYRDPAPNILYFPSYFLEVQNLRFYGHKTKREYIANCLNNITRPHRVLNLIELQKQPYYSDVFVSYLNKTYDNTEMEHYGELTDEEKVAYESMSLPICPAESGDASLFSSQHSANALPYQNSYMSIVTETTMNTGLFTEKTIKPIAAKQFMTILGGQYSMRTLKQMGIDIFDDIFDHQQYDTEPDWRLRIQQHYEVIKPYMSLIEMRNLYETNKHRLEKNAAYIQSPAFIEHFMGVIKWKLLY